MSNMHLVTGFAGREHVTASDHGSLYAALFGSGTYVLDKGKKFELTKISDNLIRVLDGDLLMQGRHCRIEDDAYVELTVENGTQGYLRRDLVVCRYTKDADSGVEGCDIVVLRGDPVGAEPADPAYVTGDIIKDGALQNDVPLYRLNLNGLEITSVDSLLPAMIPVMPEKIEGVAASVAQIEAMLAGSTSAKIQTGYYIGTGEGTTKRVSGAETTYTFRPNSIVCDFVPKICFVLLGSAITSSSSAQYAALFMCEGAETATEYETRRMINVYGTQSLWEDVYVKVDDTTLSWYSMTDGSSGGTHRQFNVKDALYYYVAIG